MQVNFPSGCQRISIVGTTGSGKTTLARAIAHHYQLPHIELDALYWGPNWTAAPKDVFRDRVSEALQGDHWVVDGNYGIVRDLVWQKADTVMFLDYSFWVVLGRLLRRTWRRSLLREELWNGNQENFRMSFLSQDSILLWMLQTYQRNRTSYPRLLQQPEYAHLLVVQLKSPKQKTAWLK
jgi:adenylate kinase family enzyme